ncbi:MAG: hypothetical protein KDJ33_08610 [Gammaproteobacteria bacterium]|nr:hypothetical protein [Gammaproteobacteria bacterium]
MYRSDYPEDSTLRRHHESAAAFAWQAFLALPPSDSVLRRHYEQQRVAVANPVPNRPTAAPDPAADPAADPAPTRPAPVAGVRRETTTGARPRPAESTGGGLFGWLKRLFG